jgi:quercetin dioxygenase-like cupin family protein
MSEFMTPPEHVNFQAKKLFGAVGTIVDRAVTYMDLDGGGPTELHTHDHNHLFIVTEGEAKILLGEEEVIIHKDEAFLVEGRISHSCWNNIDGVTKIIGITVK